MSCHSRPRFRPRVPRSPSPWRARSWRSSGRGSRRGRPWWCSVTGHSAACSGCLRGPAARASWWSERPDGGSIDSSVWALRAASTLRPPAAWSRRSAASPAGAEPTWSSRPPARPRGGGRAWTPWGAAAPWGSFGGALPGTSIRLDTRRAHYEELALLGAFHHTPGTIRRAVEALESGVLAPDSLITHRMRLDEVGRALELMARGEALKVLIEP